MAVIRQFLSRITHGGAHRATSVTTVSMGRRRDFDAYDVGMDTFVLERGISRHLGERPSVLIVEKSALRRGAKGWVMTMTTGNHAVAALPLLDGRFWQLAKLVPALRGETMANRVLCANVVSDALEISQREIPLETLVKSDAWLRSSVGFSLNDIVMVERNDATLDYFRRLGQEWRVKPLAWTAREMRVALTAAKKRIATKLTYYHSTRGVHFLTYPDFVQFAGLAQSDPEAFVCGLDELVGVYEGNEFSFVRMPKYRGHHEIEFFGLPRGVSEKALIPELERLAGDIAQKRIGALGLIQRAQELTAIFAAQLSSPGLADETQATFSRTLYMYITGEVYSVVGEGSTPAFDDRRTALPGATFVDGRPSMHPGADARTEILLSNLRGLMSKDEQVEYANVYELRGDDSSEVPLGRGATREIVYKTSRRPLENSLIEKRLSHSSRGYSGYMLARIGALRALGIALSDRYLLLKHRPGKDASRTDYYIRSRCEGEPLTAIPASYFRAKENSALEDREVVLALAALMGDAAAQNMAMKKYDPNTASPLYGVGKEIYAFTYDIVRRRTVPMRVSTCSIRGSFGWPSLEMTDANVEAMANFYLGHYAHTLKQYQRHHASVTMFELAKRFMAGFDSRTRALQWKLSVLKDQFETFVPDVPPRYQFLPRWRFVMWALQRQEGDLPALRQLFFEKVKVVESESLRNNPQ